MGQVIVLCPRFCTIRDIPVYTYIVSNFYRLFIFVKLRAKIETETFLRHLKENEIGIVLVKSAKDLF